MKVIGLEYKDKSIRNIYKLRHIKRYILYKPLKYILKNNKNLLENYLKKELSKNTLLSVPIDIILFCLDKNLNIEINSNYLDETLKDWVTTETREISNTSHYFIANGDYTSVISKICKNHIYKEMLDLKTVNMDYKKSKIYENMLKRMKSNRPIKRQQRVLNSNESIEAYFERFLNLYYSIKQQGLIKHDEFKEDRENRAIGIAVYKDGSIIKLAGAQHRVSITKILGLKKMPVQIRQIHKEYLDKIMNLYDIGYIDAILKIVYLTQEKFQE